MQMMKQIKQERNIGYNISRLLKEKGMTDQELADALTCSVLHVIELKTGSVGIEDEELEQIASVFQVEQRELYEASVEDALNYNVHCMGEVANPEDMSSLLDKIDLYVRLLNQKKEV